MLLNIIVFFRHFFYCQISYSLATTPHWYDGYDLDGADEIVIGDHSYPENIIKEIKIISA